MSFDRQWLETYFDPVLKKLGRKEKGQFLDSMLLLIKMVENQSKNDNQTDTTLMIKNGPKIKNLTIKTDSSESESGSESNSDTESSSDSETASDSDSSD